MRSIRDLVTDYVHHMGYPDVKNEVNRLLLMVDASDDNESNRITQIMLDATTKPYESSVYDEYEVGMNGIPHL